MIILDKRLKRSQFIKWVQIRMLFSGLLSYWKFYTIDVC
ncbi:hypothetical protein AZ021_001973 [Enterobacter ludwigii]|nr:hypothetical protein AZ021_001973 [Enterobacter ludwigii]